MLWYFEKPGAQVEMRVWGEVPLELGVRDFPFWKPGRKSHYIGLYLVVTFFSMHPWVRYIEVFSITT